MIRDKNVEWNRAHLFIPVVNFSGLQIQAIITGGQVAGAALQITPDTDAGVLGKVAVTTRTIPGLTFGLNPASLGAGARIVRAVEALGMTGMLMTTAADEVSHFMMMPYDLDNTQTVGVRVWWTSAAAAVGLRTITWQVRFLAINAGTTALVAPATALNTTIAAQAPAGTTSVIERTGRGIINADTFADTVEAVALRVDMSAFDAAFVENKYLLGLELDYWPRRCNTPVGVGRTPDDIIRAPYADLLGNS